MWQINGNKASIISYIIINKFTKNGYQCVSLLNSFKCSDHIDNPDNLTTLISMKVLAS